MQEWELDPKSYTPDTISEMKFLLRTLSCKTYEKSIDAKPQPGVLLYQDYAHLVARATDFDASTTDALRFWIADYLAKLRKWLGHSEEPEELMDILVRNRYLSSAKSIVSLVRYSALELIPVSQKGETAST